MNPFDLTEQFPKYRVFDGDRYEIEKDFHDESNARREGQRLKRRGVVESYRVVEAEREGAFGKVSIHLLYTR